MQGKSLFDRHIHLGLGARAVPQPEFTGDMSWYEDYDKRHGDDGAEGRLVALYRFDQPWTSWEMHPAGDEVVCCIQGHMTLHQEHPAGRKKAWIWGLGNMRSTRPVHGTRQTLMSLWWACSSPSGRARPIDRDEPSPVMRQITID